MRSALVHLAAASAGGSGKRCTCALCCLGLARASGTALSGESREKRKRATGRRVLNRGAPVASPQPQAHGQAGAKPKPGLGRGRRGGDEPRS